MTEQLTTTLLLPTLNEIEAVSVIVPQIRKEWVDEIICIDGGSTDGTVEFMQQHGIRVHAQSGRGFGQGMLQGMHIAKGGHFRRKRPRTHRQRTGADRRT